MKKFMYNAAVLASIFILFPITTNAESAMSRLNRERMKVGRALLEMQSHNWQSHLQYYSHDIEYHDPMVSTNGIDLMAQFLARLFTASPDLVTTIEDEICMQGIYTASWTMVGSFNGIPYDAKGITIFKFNPKSAIVYYQRDYYTEGDIMINIPGLDEPLKAFRAYYRCAVDPTFDCPFEPVAADAVSRERPDITKDFQLPAMAGPRSAENRINFIRRKIGRELIEIESANWQSLLPYYADDIEYYDPIVSIKGIDTMTQFLARLFASSPNLITTVEDEICNNGVYTATWTMEGFFNGVPYTAKGMSIIKFRPGEIQAYYSRDYYTEGDIMINIPGLDIPTEAFRTYYKCTVDPAYDCPAGPATTDFSQLEGVSSVAVDLLPATFKLSQNIPNPFNPSTTIYYDVPAGGGVVSLRIYDVSGRLVRTLVNGYESEGSKRVIWNGNNDLGQNMASGTYFYRMTAPGFSQIKKMALLR